MTAETTGGSIAPPGAVRVLKFGGTSMGSGPRIVESARLVFREEGFPIVVVSAMSGVTNTLVGLLAEPEGGSGGAAAILEGLEARHLEAAAGILPEGGELRELEAGIRERIGRLAERGSHDSTDDVMAAGEDLAVLLMAAALNRLAGPQPTGVGEEAAEPATASHKGPADGVRTRARAVDARTIVRTDDRFGGAVPRDEETVERARRHLAPLVELGVIPVIQGFVGASDDGRTTTLGRGGSDFTAAIVAAAVGAREVTIWTDVDGIFTADPNRVEGAYVLPELGYEEAVELAYFGARVIHPAAAKHAVGHRVRLRIRNSFHPDRPGTLVRTDRRGSPGVAALAFKPNVTMVTVRSRPLFMAYGFLARVFDILTRHRVPVDLVATSHTSTAFTIDRDADLGRVRAELDVFAEVEVRTGLATVSAIGSGLLRMPETTGRIFTALGDLPVHLISQATDTSLSFVVDEPRGHEVVERLHRTLIDPRRGDPT